MLENCEISQQVCK